MMNFDHYHQGELSLFASPPSDQSLQSREWIPFRPTNQVGSGAAIEFNISAQSSSYVDLKRSLLRLKLQVVKGDGTVADANLIGTLINLPLHTVFSHVD